MNVPIFTTLSFDAYITIMGRPSPRQTVQGDWIKEMCQECADADKKEKGERNEAT